MISQIRTRSSTKHSRTATLVPNQRTSMCSNVDDQAVNFGYPLRRMGPSDFESWHTDSVHSSSTETIAEILPANNQTEGEQTHIPNSARSPSIYSTDSNFPRAANDPNNPSTFNRGCQAAISKAPTGFREKCKFALEKARPKKSYEWSTNPAPTIPLVGRRFSLCSEVNVSIRAAPQSGAASANTNKKLSAAKRICVIWKRVKGKVVQRVKATFCTERCEHVTQNPLNMTEVDNSVPNLHSTAREWTIPDWLTDAHSEIELLRRQNMEATAVIEWGRRQQQMNYALMNDAEDILARQEALFGRYVGFMQRTGGVRAAAAEGVETE